jgi:hypothetical protein
MSTPPSPTFEPLASGDLVDVFYRLSQDDGGYFPVAFAAAGSMRPRFGRTDGWIAAVVEEDWAPAPAGSNNPPVRLRHTHPYWSNRDGERLNPADPTDMVVRMHRRDVRRHTESRAVALSVLAVRWGGEPTLFNEEQWGRASASVSDTYISAFVDGTLYECLGPDYEVLSAYVQTTNDLMRLQPSTVLAQMHGRHRCACYFLWPTATQDGCSYQSGMVHFEGHHSCMRAMESAGIPTRFPHSVQLYQTLLAKDWQATLCLYARLRVPPTIMVCRAQVVRDSRRAAAAALDALRAVRDMRYAAKPEPADMAGDPVSGTRRGVVKLGHSWEATHVTVFRGEEQLASALERLSNVPGGDASCMLVQDFVPSEFEARAFVINGVVAHIIYSNFGRIDPDGFPVDFLTRDRAQAVAEWMGGDERAMVHAETRIGRLVDAWMVWLRCRNCEMPPALRIDCLVRRSGVGRAEVHTLELTEMGFSMLAWEDGPRLVFGALLASCFEDVATTEAERNQLTRFATMHKLESLRIKRGSRSKRRRQKGGGGGGGGGGGDGAGGVGASGYAADSSSAGGGSRSHAGGKSPRCSDSSSNDGSMRSSADGE